MLKFNGIINYNDLTYHYQVKIICYKSFSDFDNAFSLFLIKKHSNKTLEKAENIKISIHQISELSKKIKKIKITKLSVIQY